VIEGETLAARVLHTGCTARMDNYAKPAGRTAARIHDLGIRAAAGAPITVDGRVWGAVFVDSRDHAPLPPRHRVVDKRLRRSGRHGDRQCRPPAPT